jgi:hypothetical protein
MNIPITNNIVSFYRKLFNIFLLDTAYEDKGERQKLRRVVCAESRLKREASKSDNLGGRNSTPGSSFTRKNESTINSYEFLRELLMKIRTIESVEIESMEII